MLMNLFDARVILHKQPRRRHVNVRDIHQIDQQIVLLKDDSIITYEAKKVIRIICIPQKDFIDEQPQ